MVDFADGTSPSRRVGGRVLVVDDEPATLEALNRVLSQGGYRVTCHASLEPAHRALAEGGFELVLTDLYLGAKEFGYEIAETANKLRPQVPVILLTGRPSFAGACEALRSQVSEILVKPMEPEALLSVCRNTIQAAAMERTARLLEGQNRVLATVVPRMIEAKDPTTCGHSERVVGYADKLAGICGVDAEDRDSLRLAALLHDVGKVGIPEEILCKAGPLDQREREIINTHPGMGYEILAPLKGSAKVRDWVYQHHERWDGRGYPQGLAGEEVALPGRILVLAEVYDALAEARSYKSAWPVAKIIAFFRKEAGCHFDPDLAQIVADGLERQGKAFFAEQPGMLF